MGFIKRLIIASACMLTLSAHADITCSGKIKSLVKWTNSDTEDGKVLSISLENTNKFIKFDDELTITMLMDAFFNDSTIKVYFGNDDIVSCMDGWENYRLHDKGWVSVVR